MWTKHMNGATIKPNIYWANVLYKHDFIHIIFTGFYFSFNFSLCKAFVTVFPDSMNELQ